MSRFGPRLPCIFAILLVLGAAPAGAQENLDQGKTAAQLFASDCAICHKSPQGLAKSGRGLENFLRQHYTASRESAAAIAAYLQSVGNAPAGPARATKRTAKGDGGKAAEKKPAAGKPGETKPGNAKSGDAKPGDAKPGDAKSSEPKPSEPKPSEPKASEPKAGDAKASEPKPAEGAKPDKSD